MNILKELYELGFIITSGISISLVLLFILYISINKAIGYINDKKYDHNENKIVKYLIEKLDILFDDDNNYIIFIMSLILICLCTIILNLIWPLTITILIVYVILRSLRFMIRIKKNLSKLGKMGHKHLDEVNIEKFKEDTYT